MHQILINHLAVHDFSGRNNPIAPSYVAEVHSNTRSGSPYQIIGAILQNL